jgi:transposase
MRRKLPAIRESAEELKQQMQSETDVRKRQRLHMLYLFASGQVHERQVAAGLLGLERNTVGRWLAAYAEGGLEALLALYLPAGPKAAVDGDNLEQLRQALAQPEGFGSYGAVQTWLAEKLGIQMEYQAVHKLVRYKLGAKLKVARPSHPKKMRSP